MYEIHNHTDHFQHEDLFDFETDPPEPIDYWTLRDFTDIIPIVAHAS